MKRIQKQVVAAAANEFVTVENVRPGFSFRGFFGRLLSLFEMTCARRLSLNPEAMQELRNLVAGSHLHEARKTARRVLDDIEQRKG